MKRVLVIGAGGAGKTTFARRLSGLTGLRLISLDALYWRPGWVATPAREWRETVGELIRAGSWIMDGNYGSTLDLRLHACDTVVFLDRNRLGCLWRVALRRVRHLGRARPELPPRCPERLTWEFVTWIWTYPSRRRHDVLRRLAAIRENTRVVVLSSQKAIDEFLQGVGETV